MSKPVLGRGLGDLMNKAAGPKQLTPMEPSGSQSIPGPGVSSLLKGKAETTPVEKAVSEPVDPVLVLPKSKSGFPVWYLFLADVLLVAFALFLVFRDPGAVTWGRVLFASIVTLFGAGLAIAGAFIEDQRRDKS